MDHTLVISYTKVKLIKLVIFSLGASNLVACLFYAVAVHSPDHYADAPWRPDETMANGSGTFVENPSFLSEEYLRTLYWSIISLTTVGHVDVIRGREAANWEHVFAIALSILAMVFYTYVVANATTVMMRSDRKIEAYRATLERVERYLSRRGVSQSLRRLVRDHFRNVMGDPEDDDPDHVLSQLPRALRTDVMRDMNARIIAQTYVFQGCDSSLIGSICTLLKSDVFVPGQIICREGDLMRQMWFLCAGSIGELQASESGGHRTVGRRNSLSSSPPAALMRRASLSNLSARFAYAGKAALAQSLEASQSRRSSSSKATQFALVLDKPGDAIGEAAFLFSQKQEAMLVSKTKSTCLMLHRDAFNSLMNEDQHALACMRNNVIAEMKKRSHKSAESLLQKANRRKHMLITELLYSAASGDVQSIHDLLTDATSGIELSIDDGDYDGRRALHVAASEGQYAVVRSLVDHKADVNVVDRFNNTPLHDAVRSGDAAIIDLLKEEGARIGQEGIAGAMCEAAANGDTRRIGLLLASGVSVDEADYDKRTALHVAASEGNKPVVHFLLEAGASVNSKDRWGGSPLHDAVREARQDVASILREQGGLLDYDESMCSAMLCDMARRGKIDTIETLLKHGCMPDASDYDRRTCLHLAASEGALRIVELLVASKADVNVRDRWGGTPLRDAVREGHKKVAQFLTASGGELGMTELQASGELCEYARAGQCELLDILLCSGCPVNAADYDQRTALHLGASEGTLPVVRLLLSHGADVNAKDRWGNIPLQDADREGHKQVCDLLKTGGAGA